MAAVRHARRHFTPFNQFHGEIKKAVVLLAIMDKIDCFPEYDYLLTEERWELLIEEFEKALYSVSGLTPESSLSLHLKTGLFALKTQFCYRENSKNADCPVC
jgi:macrophage erythroblast attacher